MQLALMQFGVAPAQLIEELSQRLRQLGLRPHVLLQPFADGIADRARCLVIDLFEIADILGSLLHFDSLDGFRFAGLARFDCVAGPSHSGRICFRAACPHAFVCK